MKIQNSDVQQRHFLYVSHVYLDLSDLSLNYQAAIVKFSLKLTITLVLGGLIDKFLSLFKFKSKSTREVGCEIYLFSSSITTIMTNLSLLIKFTVLSMTQMKVIE